MASTADAPIGPASRRDPGSLRLASLLAVIVALCAAGGVIAADPSALDSMDWSLVAWALIAFGAGLAAIPLGKNQPTLSMDLPVLLACAFVCGPAPAAFVAFIAATDVEEFRGRLSIWRAIGNHAQVSLSVLAAGLVFRLAGGHVGAWPAVLKAAALALTADAIVNYSSVALLSALATHRSPGNVLSSMRLGRPVTFALAYAAFGLTGLLMAETYVNLGFLGLVAFSAPLLLFREAFRQTRAARAAVEALEARREALRHVDERIADERRDERNRIAEVLHDDVLQSLYNVLLRAQVIREAYRTGRLLDLEEDVPVMVISAERAIEEMRDTISRLRTSRIGQGGLLETVSLLVAHLQEESSARLVTEIGTGVVSSPEAELLIYQVTREALTNAVRHSRADTVWLSLVAPGREILLSVVDNGQGFDLAAERDGRHFGLELMRERAEAAGGTLSIESAPGCGSRISATFPRC